MGAPFVSSMKKQRGPRPGPAERRDPEREPRGKAARPQPSSPGVSSPINSLLSARVPGCHCAVSRSTGGSGALYLDAHQRLIAVVALDIAGGQIRSINSIVNPDKLRHVGVVGNVPPATCRRRGCGRRASVPAGATRATSMRNALPLSRDRDRLRTGEGVRETHSHSATGRYGHRLALCSQPRSPWQCGRWSSR